MADKGVLLRREGLYSALEVGPAAKLTAIPYFAWANREPALQVWLRLV